MFQCSLSASASGFFPGIDMETGRKLRPEWRPRQEVRHERQEEETQRGRDPPRQADLIGRTEERATVRQEEMQRRLSVGLGKRIMRRAESRDPSNAGLASSVESVLFLRAHRHTPWKRARIRRSWWFLLLAAAAVFLCMYGAAGQAEEEAALYDSPRKEWHSAVTALSASSSSSPFPRDLRLLSAPRETTSSLTLQGKSADSPFSSFPPPSLSARSATPRSASRFPSGSLPRASRPPPASSPFLWKSLASSYSIPVKMVGARAAIRNVFVGKQNLLLALDSQTEGVRVFLTNSTACTYSPSGQKKQSFSRPRKLDESLLQGPQEKPPPSLHTDGDARSDAARRHSGPSDDGAAAAFGQGGEQTSTHYQSYPMLAASVKEGSAVGKKKDEKNGDARDRVGENYMAQTPAQEGPSISSSLPPSGGVRDPRPKKTEGESVWSGEGGGHCYDPNLSGQATWCLNWGQPCSFLGTEPFQCKADGRFELSQAAK